jgi:hypothetical protein
MIRSSLVAMLATFALFARSVAKSSLPWAVIRGVVKKK